MGLPDKTLNFRVKVEWFHIFSIGQGAPVRWAHTISDPGSSINIGAQRDRFSAEEVYSKVLEFNDLFIEHLRTMPQSRFDNYRRSYAIELKKVPQESFQTDAHNLDRRC